MKVIIVSFSVALIILSCQQADKPAQIIQDSATTKSDTSNSTSRLDNQHIINHAFDAVVWGIPLVNYAAMQEAMTRDMKGQYNQIVY